MRYYFVFCLTLHIVTSGAIASDLEIIGFQTGQGLQFQGGTSGNYYTLEFAPTLDGPWTNWGSVSSASITGTVMSLPTPFFYRIVQTSETAFPPYATGTPIYVEADSAALAALSNFQINASASFQPRGDYATGTPLYIELDSLALSQGYATTGDIDSLLGGYVRTQHMGNLSLSGKLAIGTNQPIETVPSRTNSAIGLHVVDSGLYIERKPYLLSGAQTLPAAIALGFDVREYGRASLWLNCYEYSQNSNTYDAACDIYFGQGADFTDNSIRWSLTARPTNQGWGHDSDGQFAIFEGNASGESLIGGRRLAIFPDKGGLSGPIIMGYDDRYPLPAPNTNDTLNVIDLSRNPRVHIEGSTNSLSASRPQISFTAATNEATLMLIGSNGTFVIYLNGNEALHLSATGGIWAGKMALGTNAAISNWPGGGALTGITFNGIAAPVAGGNASLSSAPASIVVAENYTVQAGDGAVGADTSGGDIAVTLPDLADRFQSVLIRKFSGSNTLAIRQGTNTLETLSDDGAARVYDWWPDRAGWFRRN